MKKVTIKLEVHVSNNMTNEEIEKIILTKMRHLIMYEDPKYIFSRFWSFTALGVRSKFKIKEL